MAKNYTNMQEIGETIEIKQREIEIYNIKLTKNIDIVIILLYNTNNSS